MGTEKYISKAQMKDKPKKPIGLFLKDKSVTTNKIADKAVTEEKIAEAAVGTDEIKDKSITREKIADNVYKFDFLEEGYVTEEKIADGAVSPEKLKNRPFEAIEIDDWGIQDSFTGIVSRSKALFNANSYDGKFIYDNHYSDAVLIKFKTVNMNGDVLGDGFKLVIKAIAEEDIEKIAAEVFNDVNN